MGRGCNVTFDKCIFVSCTLIVVAGAGATLLTPNFDICAHNLPNVSVLAAGTGTLAVIRGGSMLQGGRGVVVQGGAHLEAVNLSIAEMQTTGVEVTGEGSSVELVDCSVCRTGEMGVYIAGGASASLERCMLCSGTIGLVAQDPGSHAHARHSQFLDNAVNGVLATSGGLLQAAFCTSSGNGYLESGTDRAGFESRDGAVMELMECNSLGDNCGCSASEGAVLMAHVVDVTRCERLGFNVFGGGRAVLVSCSATDCLISGVLVVHEGSRAEMEGCAFRRGGRHGVHAREGGEAVVRSCSSSHNEREGFMAGGGACMKVTNSHSDADRAGGCAVAGGGTLCMLGVLIDGVCCTGELPPLSDKDK